MSKYQMVNQVSDPVYCVYPGDLQAMQRSLSRFVEEELAVLKILIE